MDVAARPFGLAAGMPFSARYGQLPLRPEAEAVRATLANASRLDVLIGYTAEETRFFLPALRAAVVRRQDERFARFRARDVWSELRAVIGL